MPSSDVTHTFNFRIAWFRLQEAVKDRYRLYIQEDTGVLVATTLKGILPIETHAARTVDELREKLVVLPPKEEE